MRVECPVESPEGDCRSHRALKRGSAKKRKHAKTFSSPKCIRVCMSYSRAETHFSLRPARGSSREARILENQIKVSRHPRLSNVKTGFKARFTRKYKFINALFVNVIRGRSFMF